MKLKPISFYPALRQRTLQVGNAAPWVSGARQFSYMFSSFLFVDVGVLTVYAVGSILFLKNVIFVLKLFFRRFIHFFAASVSEIFTVERHNI